MTMPFDMSRCAVAPGNAACPLAARCLRRIDKGRPTYQAYTAYRGGDDCDGFIQERSRNDHNEAT